jgi:hypothetical protein
MDVKLLLVTTLLIASILANKIVVKSNNLTGIPGI